MAYSRFPRPAQFETIQDDLFFRRVPILLTLDTQILTDVFVLAFIFTIINFLFSVEYSDLQNFLWNLLQLASTYK